MPKTMTNPTIAHLLTRRSVSANSLGEPGPSQDEIEQILTAAARVPDHKKLVPWRFLLFQGEARAAFGEVLAEICKREEKAPSQFRLETEAKRFMRAPARDCRDFARGEQSSSAGMGAGAFCRSRLPEPAHRRHRAWLRRAVDHRVVWLQPRRARRAQACQQ